MKYMLRFVWIVIALIVLVWWQTRSGPRNNVLLVTIDTCRPDHLGCYGSMSSATKTIDALAAQGVLFKTAETCVPLALPAHASILTGLYPWQHGVRDETGFSLEDKFTTLAEALKAKGYATAAVVGSSLLSHSTGIAQGFDSFDDSMGEGKRERTAEEVTTAALGALSNLEKEQRPFLLWVHYFDPHADYRPPAAFRQRFPSSPYDGELAYTDAALGKLVAALRKNRAAWDRTLIVLTSDNGESLGAHGEATHGRLLYQSTLWTPLILRFPEGRFAKREVAHTVRIIDIMPTVLSFVRVPVPEASLPGRTLIPVIGSPAAGDDPPSFAECLTGYLHSGSSPLHSIHEGEWRYVRSNAPEMYYVWDDNRELRNLVQADPSAAAELRQKLDREVPLSSLRGLRRSSP